MIRNAHLIKLFRDEFALCNIQPGESVVVACQSGTREDYIEAVLASVESLGAYALTVRLPGSQQTVQHAAVPFEGRKGLSIDEYIASQPFAVETLKKADMIIDLTVEGLIHTKARNIIKESGGRMLLVKEPPEVLERMFPSHLLRQRCEKALDIFQQARVMRVVSEAGTDITLEFDSTSPRNAQYGFTDQPGRWDHFPGGFLAGYPIERSVKGRIVINTGDILLPMNRYLERPIEVKIEKGFITDIYGDGLDALLFKRFLESWKDKEVYATSHFGWGMDPSAIWESLSFDSSLFGQDARAFEGNFMWSTGPNTYAGRFTHCHFDIPMRDCSIFLDGKAICEKGSLVQSVFSS